MKKDFAYRILSKHSRIIVCGFLAFFLIMISLFAAYFVQYRYKAKIEIRNSINNSLNQAVLSVTNVIDSINYTMDYLSTDGEVIDLLQPKKDLNNSINSLESFWDLVLKVENYQHIYRVKFYIDDDYILSKERVNYFSFSDAENQPWYKKVIEKNGTEYWTGAHSETDADGRKIEVFSCYKLLKYYRDLNNPIAIVQLDIESKDLYDILNKLAELTYSDVGIYDESNKIIFGTNQNLIGENIQNEFNLDVKETAEGDICENKDFQLIYSKIMNTDWNIFVISEKKKIYRQELSVLDMILYIIALFLLMLFASVLYVTKFTNHMYWMISKWTDNFDTNDDNDEVLDERLSKILNKYQENIREKYDMIIQAREFELKALQAQINPHFLYNTLDIINWQIRHNYNSDPEKMVNELARYFRLSLNRGKEFLTINQEMELAKAYLIIQKHRFGGKFKYEINIDEECKECKIPKLTVQPILENALLHGVQNSSKQFCNINISAVLEGSSVIICVSDDGVGMEDNTIEELLKKDGSKTGYGLFNVNRRIKLFSGDDDKYGLEIKSQLGRYTSVIVTLKKIK